MIWMTVTCDTVPKWMDGQDEKWPLVVTWDIGFFEDSEDGPGIAASISLNASDPDWLFTSLSIPQGLSWTICVPLVCKTQNYLIFTILYS